MMKENEYTTCDGCNPTLLTVEYEKRFGQCAACYRREKVPLDARIADALRR